jgi:hypothetical protein
VYDTPTETLRFPDSNPPAPPPPPRLPPPPPPATTRYSTDVKELADKTIAACSTALDPKLYVGAVSSIQKDAVPTF